MLCELGKSTYSTVLQVHDLFYDRIHAVKAIAKSDLDHSPATRLDPIRREIQALYTLRDHPHIVSIHHVREDENFIYVATEYCHGGSIGSLLRGSMCFIEEDRTLQMFRQVLSAVHYIHRSGMSHGDISPDNVLLTARGHSKLADFSSVSWRLPGDGDWSVHPCRADGYAAPESYGDNIRPYQTQLADMWSCGALLYTLLTRKVPIPIQRRVGTHPSVRTARIIHSPLMYRHSFTERKDMITPLSVSDMILTNPLLKFTSKPTLQLLEALLKVDPQDRVKAGKAAEMCDDALRLLTEQKRQRMLRREHRSMEAHVR